jgi:type II secretory pathway predicted ATPase ExeA
MTVHQRPLDYDLENPPEGVRLNFPDVAVRLGITVSQMAQAARISTTALCRLMTNEWPKRTDPQEIYTALIALFEARGATPDEVETLFHARLSAQRRKAVESIAPPKEPKPAKARKHQPQQEDETMLLTKQTLSPEARRAFSLFRNPFDSTLGPNDQLYINTDIAFVREACLQAAMNSSFVALVGESGSGKTTAVESMEETIARDRRPVIVIRPSVLGMEDRAYAGKPVKASDILAAVITTLEPRMTPKPTIEARSKQARELLIGSVEAGNQHLLLIEEAHSMADFTLKHLKRLHEMKLGRRPLLGILLVGQPELKARLRPGYAPLREVTQRCEVVELLPLHNDLAAYLKHRAEAVGADVTKLIDAGGIEALRRRLHVNRGDKSVTSVLYPLNVNNFMTACLNDAADIGVPVITQEVVTEHGKPTSGKKA